MNKILLILSIIISVFSYVEGVNLASSPAEILLQDFAMKALKAKNDSGYISAISMAAQYQDGSPIIVYAGRNGIDDQTPINENSLFQIGSITKSFISVVILQLAQEYDFSIDDPHLLIKYFPEYPKWDGITLRQLMNMTSGIPGNGNKHSDDIFKSFTKKEYSSYVSPETILKLTYNFSLHFEPGSHFEYSNTNYTLLGQFIKRLTQIAPEEQVYQRIIKKLGLKHTYFPIDTLYDIPGIKSDEIVHGYAFTTKDYDPYPFIPFGEDITSFSLSFANTSGAMVSTPSDINIYLHALYKPEKLLTESQFKEFTRLVSKVNGQPLTPNDKDKFGFGIGHIGYYWEKEGSLIYLFNGTTNGYKFIYLYNPKTQLFLTYAVNSLSDVVGNLEDSLSLFHDLNCEKNSSNNLGLRQLEGSFSRINYEKYQN